MSNLNELIRLIDHENESMGAALLATRMFEFSGPQVQM
jgi:hypothetical protein